jgi:hypothetical protein
MREMAPAAETGEEVGEREDVIPLGPLPESAPGEDI